MVGHSAVPSAAAMVAHWAVQMVDGLVKTMVARRAVTSGRHTAVQRAVQKAGPWAVAKAGKTVAWSAAWSAGETVVAWAERSVASTDEM